MKTLIIIITHPEARECLLRNLPSFEAECCTMVVTRDELPNWVPKPSLGLSLGESPNESPLRWVGRLMTLLGYLKHVSFRNYKDFFITEYDSILTRPLPEHPGGLVTTLGGGSSAGFASSRFFHTPWWVDRFTANQILTFGDRMIRAGMIEQGFIDRWLGLMADLYRDIIQVSLLNGEPPALSYSRNTIGPEHYEEARKAIDGGAFFVHGVKSQECLDALTK